jgi:hypothetical protein
VAKVSNEKTICWRKAGRQTTFWPASKAESTLAEFTNMVLGVELEAKPADQVELRLQQVDMLFLAMHKLFE